ncbi:MAG: hypothetical protein WED05_10650 [Candidatus Atabeyarchaeum deiterrae]
METKLMKSNGVQPNPLALEIDGEAVTLRRGEIQDLHIISPDTDPEQMRMVGALGEMLLEQAKKTFRVNKLFVVASNSDFNLIMFPKKDGFVVWKTNLDIQKAVTALQLEEYNDEK